MGWFRQGAETAAVHKLHRGRSAGVGLLCGARGGQSLVLLPLCQDEGAGGGSLASCSSEMSATSLAFQGFT